MSKLDEILNINDPDGIGFTTDRKEEIKALFKDLVGEDDSRPTDCCNNEGGAICWKESKVKRANELRAELRAKIDAL